MVVVRRKAGLFQVTEGWNGVFSNHIINPVFARFNNVDDHQKVPFYWLKIRSKTIENDLSEDPHAILSKFSKQVRNAIRGAMRSGVICTVSGHEQPFLEFYNQFASLKGLPVLTQAEVSGIGQHAWFSYAKLNGRVLAAHMYIADYSARYVMLYKSASARLHYPLPDANMIGKINKYLHYADMLHFKQLGILTYEFGGFDWNDPSSPLHGINRFKQAFGGDIVEYNRYETIPYFIARRFRQAWSNLSRNLSRK